MNDWYYFLTLIAILFLALAVAWRFYQWWIVRGWGKKVFPGKNYPVCVLEDGDERRMVFSKLVTQGAISISSPATIQLTYAKHMLAALFFQPEPRAILMLGLGTGCVTRILHQYLPEAEIQVVEVEPQVAEVAGTYFHVRPERNYTIAIDDGRHFLEQTSNSFDLIILDAFADDHIPRHLTTWEFLTLVKSRLRPGGVVLANLYDGNPLTYWRYLRTYGQIFPNLYRFPVPLKGNDVVVAASDGEQLSADEIRKRANAVQEKLCIPHRVVDLEEIAGYYNSRSQSFFRYLPLIRDSKPTV